MSIAARVAAFCSLAIFMAPAVLLILGLSWLLAMYLWFNVHPAAGVAVPVILGFAGSWSGLSADIRLPPRSRVRAGALAACLVLAGLWLAFQDTAWSIAGVGPCNDCGAENAGLTLLFPPLVALGAIFGAASITGSRKLLRGGFGAAFVVAVYVGFAVATLLARSLG